MLGGSGLPRQAEELTLERGPGFARSLRARGTRASRGQFTMGGSQAAD